tara:strand:+ start:76 stop:732 length:657 start_codon:yes stop_codon:yes gene_type:complete
MKRIRNRVPGRLVSMLCMVALAVSAAACDRGTSAPTPATEGAASGETQDKASSNGPQAIESAFNPSVPAIWDETDPKAELEGREALLDYLNGVRASHNLSPVTWDDTLQAAAESHAKYIMTHKAAIDASGVSIHVQDASLSGFTGETYVTRGEYFKYPGKCFGEVVAFKPTAVGAARSWVESLYHRFPLLDESAVHVGYAEMQLDTVKVNVLEVGSHE